MIAFVARNIRRRKSTLADGEKRIQTRFGSTNAGPAQDAAHIVNTSVIALIVRCAGTGRRKRSTGATTSIIWLTKIRKLNTAENGPRRTQTRFEHRNADTANTIETRWQKKTNRVDGCKKTESLNGASSGM